MADFLEERLRGHAKAFDSLLSLIPAKLYYGEDTSDQWQRKKQTKEQKRDARVAKLDPDSVKSAKDVMVERAQKRKREEGYGSDNGETGPEMPREGMKQSGQESKKQKKEMESSAGSAAPNQSRVARSANDEETEHSKSEKDRAKKGRKQALKAEAKRERKLARKERKERLRRQKAPGITSSGPNDEPNPHTDEGEEGNTNDYEMAAEDQAKAEEISFNGPLFQEGQDNAQVDDASTATTSSTPRSPVFDHSGSSSTSSIPPPNPKFDAPKESTEKPTKLTIPNIDSEELKERLRKRLEAMRAARKADGPDGKPARNRQELIEGRRRKEEQRKVHKKEMRQKAKEEEQRKIDEDLTRRWSPASGSLLASPRSPMPESSNNFSFGRISFADGQQTDANLSSMVEQRRRKGPQDPLGALKVAQSKEARLAAYDDVKRAEIEQKDMWLNAKKHAHGERVRDDTSLLKKALKRKESTKRKSEKEWNERVEGVQKGKEMRQNKREENLRKRKDEKGVKGKKKGKKVKSRPGFEGSFKARSGGKK